MPARRPTRDPASGGQIRVLIADDHTVVRDGLVAMLGKWTDVTVVAQAENGREAVEQWRHHRPDVTLLDLRMPILDGADAINQIRAIDSADEVLVRVNSRAVKSSGSVSHSAGSSSLNRAEGVVDDVLPPVGSATGHISGCAGHVHVGSIGGLPC